MGHNNFIVYIHIPGILIIQKFKIMRVVQEILFDPIEDNHVMEAFKSPTQFSAVCICLVVCMGQHDFIVNIHIPWISKIQNNESTTSTLIWSDRRLLCYGGFWAF